MAIYAALPWVIKLLVGEEETRRRGYIPTRVAPLLAVGAVWGALAARLVDPVWPAAVASPAALAMVGMAAFFAAVVRAPLTGMVLIVEMTAVTSLLVPMLAACFAAVLVATLVGAEPIYDSLRARLPRVGEGA